MLRAAISRAYYAVFLTVREQLFGPDGRRLTKRIRKHLNKKSKSNLRSHDVFIFAITDVQPSATLSPVVLSQQVGQLKEARIHADYNFSLDKLKTIPKQTWREYAEEAIPLALHLLTVTRKLPPY